jgi:hypothetical protein
MESRGLGQGRGLSFKYTDLQLNALEATLSAPRLATYLARTQANRAEAVRLYEANTLLCEALYPVLQGVEIAARNCMHSVMKAGIGKDDWYRHVQLKVPERESVASAERKILRAGKAVTADRIVSELSFGFWVALCCRHYAAQLWVPHLNRAFAHARLGHKDAHERLNEIRSLRNRVAHHECILGRNLERDYREILEAIGWICPDTSLWIQETNRFEEAFEGHYRRRCAP